MESSKRWLFFLILVIIVTPLYSQMFSFSTFGFSIYDGGNIVESLYSIDGFEPEYGPNFDFDTASVFRVTPIYYDNDVKYQKLYYHMPGAWVIFAEDVDRYRPLRFFKIEKRLENGEIKAMRIFLNYDYNSCTKMPCVIGTDVYDISEILFKEGNYMLTGRLSISDWKNKCDNIVKIEGDIINFILKNEIKIWNIKRLK